MFMKSNLLPSYPRNTNNLLISWAHAHRNCPLIGQKSIPIQEIDDHPAIKHIKYLSTPSGKQRARKFSDRSGDLKSLMSIRILYT